jgi:hypothetical protein
MTGAYRIALAAIMINVLPLSLFASSSRHGEKARSAGITLGHESDFERTGPVLLPNHQVWGKVGRHGQISYRALKAKSKADLLFVPFEINEMGFCKRDMILEVFYRDDAKQRFIDEYRVQGRVIVQSRVDFSKDNEYVEIGHLDTEGDGKWKLAQMFLERTPRQLVRAIGHSFQFRVVMPPSGSKNLPISYVRLISVDHQQFVTLREEDRARRGLKRIDYEAAAGFGTPPEEWEKRGFVVYPVNCLELVFTNSPVDYDRAGDELECFEVPGQSEPVSFVIHAFTDLSNVRVEVSDLHSELDTISASRIHLHQVVRNDQRWGWSNAKHYGTCPDYLSFENPVVDIKNSSNCQFWMTIDVPADMTPGEYSGTVLVQADGIEPYRLPLKVEVLDIELPRHKARDMVYYSPHYRNLDRDPVRVLEDMKKHGLVPIYYPPRKRLDSTDLSDFERQLAEFRQVYPDVDTLFVGLSDHGRLWIKMRGPRPEFQRRFPLFESTYGKRLRSYAALAQRYNLTLVFTFADEPGDNAGSRRISYLCSHIAQSNGLKTWCTFVPYYDVQLPLTNKEVSERINYLRPLSEVLDEFVCHISHVDASAIKHIKKRNSNVSYYTTYPGTSIRCIYNRFLHGLYRFAVGGGYVVCYAYRHERSDPYDDLDRVSFWAPDVGMNDYVLTYPTWQGEILPTLSYEALREGVEDSRLISTMLVLAGRASSSHDPGVVRVGKESEEFLQAILRRMSKDFRRDYFRKHKDLPVDPMEEAILRDLNDGRSKDYGIFDKIRRGVCDRIIRLEEALGR